MFCLFVCLIWFFTSHQQSFNYKGTDLPWLNQYLARINVSCSRTQHSDAGEARTRGPLVSSQALYHCATALPNVLFDLILFSPVMSGWVFLGWASTKQGIKCLVQRHNAVPPVRLEGATPQSQVKHSTTEPPLSSITCTMALLLWTVSFAECIELWNHKQGFSYLSKVGVRGLVNMGKYHLSHQNWEIWCSLKESSGLPF